MQRALYDRESAELENEDVILHVGCPDRSSFIKLDDYIRIAKPQLAKIAVRG